MFCFPCLRARRAYGRGLLRSCRRPSEQAAKQHDAPCAATDAGLCMRWGHPNLPNSIAWLDVLSGRVVPRDKNKKPLDHALRKAMIQGRMRESSRYGM